MILWVHETTLTTKSEGATCQKKPRAVGFSEDGVSESFKLFERTVEYKVNYILIYGYNINGSALITFKVTPGKVITEKCNISFTVNLKCEECKHYSGSNCLLSPPLVAVQLRW